MRPNQKCPIALKWVHCPQNLEVDSCCSFQLLQEPSGVQRMKSFTFPWKNDLDFSLCVFGVEAP